MKIAISCLGTLGLLVAASAPVQGAIVFQDNFDALGTLSGSKYTNLPATTGTLEFTAVADSTSIFGASNVGMLKAKDTGSSQFNVTTKIADPMGAGVISFSMLETASNSGSTNDFFRLALQGPSPVANISFDDGKISVPGTGTSTNPYAVGTVADFDIYFNTTASSVTIDGVSVAAGKIRVYVNDVFAVASTTTITTAITNISFQSNGTDATMGEVNLDNLVVSVVPEPSSLALVSLGGFAMLRRRRR